MNQAVHLSSQFDEDLGALRTRVLQMGGVVESQIRSAIEAYTSGNASVIESVVETESKVNQLEIEIDDACAHIIAKRQPTASDLRMVLAVSKIVTDLERAGDEAKKIATSSSSVHERGQVPSLRAAEIRHVAEAAVSMLRQALDSLARLDAASARAVILADKAVDSEFRAIVRQLITYMMEDPRTISTALDIIWIARAIERIGDHAKNVAEQVIFVVEGRDVRHSGLELGN